MEFCQLGLELSGYNKEVAALHSDQPLYTGLTVMICIYVAMLHLLYPLHC